MCKLLLLLLSTATIHATVGLNDHLIPLVHDGGGWSSQITVVNLSGKPASVIATFLTPTGFNPVWALSLKSTTGKVVGNLIDLPLAAEANAIIETSGSPAALTRGFVELIELVDRPIGAHAVLTQKEGDRVLQRIQIPLSPVHERRSLLPLDLVDPTVSPELGWISLTTSCVPRC